MGCTLYHKLAHESQCNEKKRLFLLIKSGAESNGFNLTHLFSYVPSWRRMVFRFVNTK